MPQRVEVKHFPYGDIPSDAMLARFGLPNKQIRDGFHLYEDIWRPHIHESQQAIIDAMSGLGGDVLVIGVGNGLELPLRAMLAIFNTVTLVDIDRQSLDYLAGNVSRYDQSKLRLVVDDITGVVTLFERDAKVSAYANGSADDFADDLGKKVDALYPTVYRYPGRYDFVVASLVASQPFTSLHDIAIDITRDHFTDELPRDNPLTNAFIYQTSHFPEVFFRSLSQCVKPDGRVYFADSTDYIPLKGLGRSLSREEAIPMMDRAILDYNLSVYFTVDSTRSWTWIRNLPNYGYNDTDEGFEYAIEAYTLSPKITD